MTIKLDHINITVENLATSTEWYGKVFGFKPVESGKTAQGAKWGIIASNDSMICMTEYANRISADKFKNDSAYRMYHFGLRVSDLNHWRRIIQDQELKINYGGQIDYPNSISWYLNDPSGHEIEVSFTVEECLQFPKAGL
jgi:catechol-2,3-dioxygenase